jgi:putative transposase
VEKLRYIHRNPVKRGLCKRPEDWQWSSFFHYATGIEGVVEIESEWTARKRERAEGKLCPAIELPHSS